MSQDIPCNISSMLKVRNGHLEWFQVMRSNDLYLGTPHNFVQFTTLQEIMAGWLGLGVGSYVQVSDSLHLYEENIAKFSVVSEAVVAKNTDRLYFPHHDFEKALSVVAMTMEELRDDALTRDRFAHLIAETNLPEGWHNLLRIAAADAVRRRGWDVEMMMIAESCSNPALNKAWERWLRRKIAEKVY